MDVLLLRVQVVEDDVGVAAVRGREDYDLEELVEFGEDFLGVRSDH